MLLTNPDINGLPWTVFTASQEHHLIQLIFQTFSFNGEKSSYGKWDTYKQHVSLVLHWAFYSTFVQLVCTARLSETENTSLFWDSRLRSIKVAFSHVNANVFPAVRRNEVTAGNTSAFPAYTTSPFARGRGIHFRVVQSWRVFRSFRRLKGNGHLWERWKFWAYEFQHILLRILSCFTTSLLISRQNRMTCSSSAILNQVSFGGNDSNVISVLTV